MLAYAANAPRTATSRPSPSAMLLIVTAHIAAIALVMSAKMDLPARIIRQVTKVDFIPLPAPPPNDPPPQPDPQRARDPLVDRPIVIFPIPHPPIFPIGHNPDPLPLPGGSGGIEPLPQPEPLPLADPVKLGPRLATPAGDLRPPYPASKLASEEEAVLRLRLSIDPQGRVVAVDAAGPADPAFLAAARRHLIAHWRYKPATVGGRAVESSTVITLRFELNG